jgi:hypothetical protein
VARYINSYFAHRFDRFGTNMRGRGPGALDFKPITGDTAQDTLSHLASRGVSGAEYKYSFFIHL